jgi:hypothetical protein
MTYSTLGTSLQAPATLWESHLQASPPLSETYSALAQRTKAYSQSL